MFSSKDFLDGYKYTQAWRFAGLVQDRLMRPVKEKVIVSPADPTPGSPDCGVSTYIAPNGVQIRASSGVEKVCETWVDASHDGGQTWRRIVTLTKEDEMVSAKELSSVEHPYLYGKMVSGEPYLVMGSSAAEKATKCWDIREREAPLAHLEKFKGAWLDSVLTGNAEYAYKDGAPIQSPDGQGIYFAATRHHIYGPPASGVNADTVLCKYNDKLKRYEIMDVILPRYARGSLDRTCNRLTSELVFPDGSRFWGCDVRNAEIHNEAAINPLKPGDYKNWRLGNFDEVTSCAVATWPPGDEMPTAVSVPAVLGWSTHPNFPALRYLGVVSLLSAADIAGIKKRESDEATAIILTYEKADKAGNKNTFQQEISCKELSQALNGKGLKLILEQDPALEVKQRHR